jgi:hypothetical protein
VAALKSIRAPEGSCGHVHDAFGFLFTPFFDDWTHDDFRRFVFNEDYTIVDPDYVDRRPTQMAEQMARLLNGYQDARILDYGAGRGVFHLWPGSSEGLPHGMT